MIKRQIFFLLVLFLFVCITPELFAAPEKTFADQGTFEMGAYGAFYLPVPVFIVSLFGNYYILKDFHIGGSVIGGTTGIFVMPSVGYTIPLSPVFQLDFSARAGVDLILISGIHPAFDFGGGVRLMFPVFERALIGIGGDFSGTLYSGFTWMVVTSIQFSIWL